MNNKFDNGKYEYMFFNLSFLVWQVLEKGCQTFTTLGLERRANRNNLRRTEKPFVMGEVTDGGGGEMF